MKKRLLFAIMNLAMVLSLCACGKEKLAIAEAPAEVAVEVAAKAEPAEVEEVAPVIEERNNGDTLIQWTNEEIKDEILHKLGKNKDKIDTVTVAEAASITEISFTLYENFDTTDMKYLTGAEYISVFGNKLTDISFVTELNNLNSLTLMSENLTDLSLLKDNKSIESLYINTYGLVGLSGLSGMTSLKELYIETDALSDVSTVGELINLEECEISSYSLESINADFSNLKNLRHIGIQCEVLSDATALSTIPFILGTTQEFCFNDCELSEETAVSLANWVYEKWCLECKTNGEEKYYQYENHYNESYIEFYHCPGQVSDLYETYFEQLVAEKGHPRDLIPLAEKPQPSLQLQETFERPEFGLDGQLISLPCPLQTLFDYGYVVADDTDLEDKVGPGRTCDIELEKPNSNIKVQIEAINQDERLAKAIAECLVYSFEYDAEDIPVEERPEFYIVKCKYPHPERGTCSESGYITWDSKINCIRNSVSAEYLPKYKEYLRRKDAYELLFEGDMEEIHSIRITLNMNYYK